MNKQRMMAQSSTVYRMDRKKMVTDSRPSELSDYFIEADMTPVGPELGKSDLNAGKFGSGFRRKQQAIIQQDKERKENEQMLAQRKDNRRELRRTFLEQTNRFQTRVNIITGENMPDPSSKTSKRVYEQHNRDEITKPLQEKRNLQKEERIANDGLFKKKDYSVKDYFHSYSSYY